jgi:hypothetical protein
MSRLAKLVTTYKNQQASDITPAQIELIKRAAPDVDPSTLKRHEVGRLLHTLKDDIFINCGQMAEIINLCTLTELRQILKREDVYLDKITLNEYHRIVQVKINPKSLRLFTINHPITITEDYEYGWQESKLCPEGKMFYLKFNTLCMLDLDADVRSISQRLEDDGSVEAETQEAAKFDLQRIEALTLEMDLTVRIYATHNGYHIFITSRPIHYSDPDLEVITAKFESDIYYRIFCQRFGYKIRLNAKLGREETIIAKFVAAFGHQPEDPQLLDFLAVHDAYLLKHQCQC